MKGLYFLPGKREKLTLSPLSCIKVKCSVIECADTCHISNERMHNRWKRMWVDTKYAKRSKHERTCTLAASIYTLVSPKVLQTLKKPEKTNIYKTKMKFSIKLGCLPRWKNRDCIYPTLNNQKIRTTTKKMKQQLLNTGCHFRTEINSKEQMK